MNKCFIVIFLVFVVLSSCANALDNGLALTPPMGWVTWERYRCITNCTVYPNDCISEQLIRRQADFMVSGGYLKAGYEFIILDTCWALDKRDKEGRYVADPDRFPNGIKALADYVHGKGLKFGIQIGFPGNKIILKYLEIDAKTFAEWGVDYLKLEGDCNGCDNIAEGYIKMGHYLNATGRPIVYSCRWAGYQIENGVNPDYEGNAKHCNLWRNLKSIGDTWESVISILTWYGSNQDKMAHLAGPGHWNNPDSLIIGNAELSFEQSKTQMAFWAIIAAPLIMSNDLATIHPRDKAILLNRDIIAINQDKLGIQGRYITTIDYIYTWTKPILPMIGDYYSYAIAFLNNRGYGSPCAIFITLAQLELHYTGGYVVESIFDDVIPISLFLRSNETFEIHVPSTGVVLLRARPVC